MERERERKIVRGLKALYLVHLAAEAEWHSDGAPDEKLCCGGWELCTQADCWLVCYPHSIDCNTYTSGGKLSVNYKYKHNMLSSKG